MSAYLLTNHLLNLVAPALFVALGLALATRLMGQFFRSKRPPAQSLYAQVAIIFVVNVLTLVVGLVVFGNDGKMLTYAALVLGAALCQTLLLGNVRT
ncbi:MAG: hypothetical protein EAZ34_08005 [Polaromonas sp.]|nr:MAG: hypothetical protein EAZ34_08005 [Polaromonas sp.]